MISKKVAMAILAILALGVVVYACNPGPAEAQTAPEWIGTDMTAGKTPVYQSVIGDMKLSIAQFAESSAWVGTIWGRDTDGVWTRITPTMGSSATDTTLTIDGTTPFLRFPDIKAEVFVTHSGTATVWGEREDR